MKKSPISYADFAKLDLRIGQIMSVEVVEDSRKLLQLRVDLGDEYGELEILAGIRQYVETEDLLNRKFIFLANLEPKKMGSKTSHGMMIAAIDHEKPILISIHSELANGTTIC